MRQRIENKQEKKLIEASVTVTFHASQFVLGRFESFRARESAAPALSGELAVIRHRFFDTSSPSGFVKASPERRRARSPSLPHTEKFSAEGQLACSDLAILVANPITCSPQAAATVITTMTEQRRCAAA